MDNQIESFTYLKRYWMGRIPIDGVLFARIILLCLIFYQIDRYSTIYMHYFIITNLSLLFLADLLMSLGMIFTTIWIAVGTFRSIINKNNNNFSKKRYFYGSLLICTSVILASYIGWHNNIIERTEHHIYQIYYGKDPLFDESIVSKVSDEEIEINGEFIFGLTNEVANYFTKYPNIKTVKLNSLGGSLIVGHNLHAFLKSKSVTIYTTTGCESACVYAFLAGTKRIMYGKYKLGFHSARNTYAEKFEGTDTGKFIDALHYRSGGGIDCSYYNSEEFCNKVKATPWNEMWWPTVEELKLNRIITDYHE